MFSEHVIRAAYEKGILLSDAIQRLSTSSWRRAYGYARKRDAARNAAVWRELRETAETFSTTVESTSLASSPFENMGNPYANLYSKIRVRYSRLMNTKKLTASEYERQMQSAIQVATLDGRYKAVGFEIPRKASDPPVVVPNDLLKSLGHFEWKKSRINGNGLEFEAVRLLPISWLLAEPAKNAALQKPPPPDAIPTPKYGPRSRETEVDNAYRDLCKQGDIDAGETDKSVWKKVRGLIVERTANPRGLAYTTVVPFLKKLRQSDQKYEITKSSTS